jgi:crossover junction endodeoxyribonuclease RuvC
LLVLGIDPGTAVTGYGLVRGDGRGPCALVECGVIRTRARDPLPARLLEIHEGVREIIARFQPEALAVEDIFYAKNVRTTVSLGHARGVVLLAGQEARLRIHEFAPREVKKAIVGSGAASKDQVQFMVARLLRLRTPPHPADASDAVAAALSCLMQWNVLRIGNRESGVGSRSALEPRPRARVRRSSPESRVPNPESPPQ